MALVERVIMQAVQTRTSILYTLRISQEDFPGSQEPDLTAGESSFVFTLEDEEGGDTPHGSVFFNSLTVSLKDIRGNLSFLQSIDEREVYVTLEAGGVGILFDGWIVPAVEYSYDRYRETIVSFTAKRGAHLLRQTSYTTGDGGVKYSGYDSLLSVIQKCYDKADINWPFRTSVHWVPYLQTTQFTSTDDTLKNLLVNQGAMQNSDGEPYVAFDVLRMALRLFQASAFVWNRYIYILQRKRVNAANSFNVHNHPFDLQTTPTLETLDYSRDIWGDDNPVIGNVQISFTAAFKGASLVYNHNAPTAGILGNPSFEEALVLSGSGNWIATNPNVSAQRVNEGFPDGDINNNWSYELGTHYYDPTSAAMTDPYTQVLTTDFIRQTLAGVVEGGINRSLQIQFRVKINNASGTILGAGNVYVPISIQIGSYYVYRDTLDFNTYKLSTTPPGNRDIIWFELVSSTWQSLSITTDALDDGGPITDVPVFTIYAPTEDWNGSATPGVQSVQFDLIGFDVLGEDGNAAGEATQYSSFYSLVKNYRTPRNEVVLWGDGPTTGHENRFKVIDGAGNEEDITTDWQFGRTFGTESNLSHGAFWSMQLLKERRYGLMKASFTILFDNTHEFEPYMLWRDVRSFELVNSATTDDTTIRVRIPAGVDKRQNAAPVRFRNIELNGEIHRVAWSVTESNDPENPEWTLHLETPLLLGGGVGDPVTQEFFFTNKRVEIDVLNSLISVTAIELLEGDEPGQNCAINVKKGSVPADVLPDYSDSLCAPPILVTYYAALSTGNVYKFPVDPDTGTAVGELLFGFTGNENVYKVRADEDAGRLFALVRNDSAGLGYVKEYDLDGAFISNLITFDFSTGGAVPTHLVLDRVNKKICVVTIGNPSEITEYNYAGAVIGVLASGANQIYRCLSYNASGSTLYYINSTIPTFSNPGIFSVDVATTSATLITNITAFGVASDNCTMRVDESAGYMWISNGTKIWRLDLPALTNVIEFAGTSDKAHPISINRTNGEVTFSGVLNDFLFNALYSNTDGTNLIQVAPMPEGPSDEFIDLDEGV